MTRAMHQLILTRAVYRRRYGTDLPEASVPSRFLEEVAAPLIEELGTPRRSRSAGGACAAWRGRGQSLAHPAPREIPRSEAYAYEEHRRSNKLTSRGQRERS